VFKHATTASAPTELPLRDGLSPEEYDQLFELFKKARALVAAAT
jgi:hypothetical protein